MELYKPQLKYNQHVFDPGEYQIDIDVYHASAGISRSGISELKKSPLHYWQSYLAPDRVKKEPTKQMIFGDALHTMILEPDYFDQRFAVSKKFDCRTNAGKAAKAEFELTADGKKVLDEEEFRRLERVVEEVQMHPLINRLLKGAKIEKSLFWIDGESELLCKARPDAWTPRCLIDIKTTADACYNEFSRSVNYYDYHIQAAMQIDAVAEITGELMHDFLFIAVQTTPPHKPYLYNLGDIYIEYGREQYKKLLKILRACFDSDSWDDDRNQVIELDTTRLWGDRYIDTLLELHKIAA
jgi:hypothetical protein